MEKTDIKIIACLRSNARTSLKKMSKLLGIPISTIFDKIKFHRGKTIKKYCAIIDDNLLEYNARAKVFIKKGNIKKDELKEHLMKHLNVNNLYKINNGYEFIADVVFKGMQDLEAFLENLEQKFGVKNPEVHYIIDELKSEGFLADPRLSDMM
jgi:DNA-binding Lrp family transcriptional regulator